MIIITVWILSGIISGLIASRIEKEGLKIKHFIVVTMFGCSSLILLIIAFILDIFIKIFDSECMQQINKFLNKQIKL